ncbi:MAG: hypothetical protein GX571_11625 [Lentisphaerae bacterium]|nr:hypothetical protein [Lentisphaerota bacterium]
MERTRPRFPGHVQPRTPLWGYGDESDPAVMAQKIDAAADHGLDAFIFDWYHYNDGPFLEGALDRSYLGAPNRGRVKFALMWANHDWVDIHPARRGVTPALLYPGAVTPAAFQTITDLVIARYFRHPDYGRVAGRTSRPTTTGSGTATSTTSRTSSTGIPCPAIPMSRSAGIPPRAAIPRANSRPWAIPSRRPSAATHQRVSGRRWHASARW